MHKGRQKICGFRVRDQMMWQWKGLCNIWQDGGQKLHETIHCPLHMEQFVDKQNKTSALWAMATEGASRAVRAVRARGATVARLT